LIMGLDTVELIIEIERHFDIHIEDEEAEKLNTVQSIINHVKEKLEIDNRELKLEIITKHVINIVSNKAGIDKQKIKLTNSITQDLGLD